MTISVLDGTTTTYQVPDGPCGRRVSKAELLAVLVEQLDSIFHPVEDLGLMTPDGTVDIVDALHMLAGVLDEQLPAASAEGYSVQPKGFLAL